jgi:hypothetical protein
MKEESFKFWQQIISYYIQKVPGIEWSVYNE